MVNEKEKKTGEKSMENEKINLFSSDHPPYIYIFPPPCLFTRGNGKSELTEKKLEEILQELKDGTWKEMDF